MELTGFFLEAAIKKPPLNFSHPHINIYNGGKKGKDYFSLIKEVILTRD
jgi:hypothetical protein